MIDNPRLREIEEQSQARSEYLDAHWRGVLQRVFSLFGNHRAELLSLSDIKSIVKPTSEAFAGIQTVEVECIVGSEDRYADFSRTFLPRRRHSSERWVNIRLAHSRGIELPPVTLYELGGVYFVRDGNHRVSVARQEGTATIEAHVIEIASDVPVTPDLQPDDLIIKAEYAEFLEKSEFKRLFPEEDLLFTVPGQYQKLLEHIEIHRYFMGLDFQRDIPYEESVSHWYETVYLPIIEPIREG